MEKKCFNTEILVIDLNTNTKYIFKDEKEVALKYNKNANTIRAYLNNHMQFKNVKIKMYWLTEYALEKEKLAYESKTFNSFEIKNILGGIYEN